MHARILLVGFLLAALAASAFAGKVYRWVDENGQVHYTEQPPPDRDTDELRVQQSEPDPVMESAGTDEAVDGPSTPDEIRALLPGRWLSKAEDQTITLTLGRDGSLRWKVIFRGKPWSDLRGHWRVDEQGAIRLDLGLTGPHGARLDEQGRLISTSDLGTRTVFEKQ